MKRVRTLVVLGAATSCYGACQAASGLFAGKEAPKNEVLADSSVQTGSRVPVTPAAAARLLDQSAFGPTATDIYHVQQVGLQGYLNEQFHLAPTVLPQFPSNVGDPCDSGETCWGSDWWMAAATAPDQLRQRVAFALSHMFVTSTNTVGGYAMVSYYNLLLGDAFTNWRTVMQDVTLSPSSRL